MDIYGFEASEGFISDVTDKLLPQIEEWQKRPLSEIYPVIFIDAIHYSVRDNNVIRKLAAYVILGINCEGRKEVLSIQVGENESAKYWLSVLNELRNRGVKDILILCADGLTGIKEQQKTGMHIVTETTQVFHTSPRANHHNSLIILNQLSAFSITPLYVALILS